jgi:uncharacterized membrane protein YecN with MAPEG domain
MPVSITALYAGVLALKVPLGDGGNPQMLRMTRIHGNTVEYVPLGLLLMGLYELNGGLPFVLNIAGIALVVGRLFYAWGMWNTAVAGFPRIAGTSLTWLTIAALAVLNLWQIR